MLRTFLALIGGALVLAGAVGARPEARSQEQPTAKPVTVTTFLVSGRGWGHGVGMSQYGALGLANDGRLYDEILAHYYPGTRLSPAPVARVRVLLAEGASTLTVGSDAPFRVRDVFGKLYPLAAGSVKVGPTFELPVNGAPTRLTGPISFLPGRSPLVLGTAYRGQIDVAVAGGKVTAVNAVALEQYLAGVVPREMPASWAEEALKAQAVAARSYALAHRVRGKAFDLYADVRSQVYGGIASEDARATRAIGATAGEVLTYGGAIANAMFHSTSGGATISAEEAFGAVVPYLVGVEDPFSSISPVHAWGPVAVRAVALGSALKLRAPALGLKLVRTPSGRVRSATVSTSVGPQTVSGGALRTGAGLRSTWITKLATVSLTRPGGPAPYMRKLDLTARGQGAKVTLQTNTGGAWTTLGGPSNRVVATAALGSATSYRLLVGGTVAATVRIPVAPLVAARRTPTGIAGQMTPPREGATVQVQRLEGGAWTPVGEAVVDSAGAFAAELELPPGSYRARVAPGAGLVQGLSPTLAVG